MQTEVLIMLEISSRTNLLEQKSYRYSLQNVENPNLLRDIYTEGEVPKVSLTTAVCP